MEQHSSIHLEPIQLEQGDALIVVDVQVDFVLGGNLAVPEGEAVIPVLNHYIRLFRGKRLPIFATRDWHPTKHSSFHPHGGPWPPHCIQDTEGAQFAAGLQLPDNTVVISKATTAERDAYSGFEGTDLDQRLRQLGVKRLFVGGLATDYCVLNTVMDGLSLGYQVFLLEDAIRAVNVHPEDGRQTEEKMVSRGATPVRVEHIAAPGGINEVPPSRAPETAQ
jgi:nicotinamidase/pyrazinamidase